jgi:hypothetical protein
MRRARLHNRNLADFVMRCCQPSGAAAMVAHAAAIVGSTAPALAAFPAPTLTAVVLIGGSAKPPRNSIPVTLIEVHMASAPGAVAMTMAIAVITALGNLFHRQKAGSGSLRGRDAGSQPVNGCCRCWRACRNGSAKRQRRGQQDGFDGSHEGILLRVASFSDIRPL